MVPNVLMQFIHVTFQIALNLLYRHTPFKAFVLSNLRGHINEYHEKVYMKTVDKQHQKGGSLILGFQPNIRLLPNIRLNS